MSDWEVDGVADNAWSSLDEVAWIECESKGDHCITESGMLRGLSCTSREQLQRAAGDSSEQGQELSHQVYQRLRKYEACSKTEAVKELNTQESGYRVKERVVLSREGGWYDNCIAGASPSVVPFNVSTKPSSATRGEHEEEASKEVSSYSFEGAEMCKDESSYHEDGADIVNGSCHFLLSDMCPPGDLEFLAEVQEEARGENLLEFGWGNTNHLEDIDELFSSTDSVLSRSFDNNSGMLWDPPSPTLGDSLESLQQPATRSVTPEFVPRGAVKAFEATTDLSTGNSLSKQEVHSVSEQWRCPGRDKQQSVPNLDNSCLPVQVDSFTDCSNRSDWESQGASEGRTRGAECMGSEGFHALKESRKVSKIMQFGLPQTDDDSTHPVKEGERWKMSKGRRHGHRSRKTEDNSRKPTASGRKIALNVSQANNPPLVYVPVVPVAQEPRSPSVQASRVSSCEALNTMQCLQPVPYVHAGFGFPSHHHLPLVVPSTPVMPQQVQQQGQPVFISYQPSFVDVPKFQRSKGIFDVSSQSPTASSTMTPQEKIEKLRWRQKMQARLAVEQQQQQLINQRLIPEQTQFGRPVNSQLNSCEEVLGGSVSLAHTQNAEPFNWNEKPMSVEEAMVEDGDESLSATVLHQLLNIASKMDTRTRLCLRDGFHRLARNALQRRASLQCRGFKRNNSERTNRSCTAESSSSSDQSCSQRLLTVDDIVETETNPMDRFIAHLLFHKRFPSSYTPVHMNHIPHNNSECSDPSALQQNGWAPNEEKKLSHPSPATRSSSITGEVGVSKGVTVIPDLPSSNGEGEKANIRSACLSQSVVSDQQLEKVLNFSAVPVDNSLHHPVENGTAMADKDPDICPSTGTMDISGEVA